MIPWQLLGTAIVPGARHELRLYRHDTEYAIRVGGAELMSSDANASESALAELAIARLANKTSARVLVGGLGMGYTAAAALSALGRESHVCVAELVPEVIEWNRGPLAHLAGRPLEDPRVSVRAVDVGQVIREKAGAWDAILLDVDNGPSALTSDSNNWLYLNEGLRAIRAALRESGILAVWSADPSRPFVQRLKQTGYYPEEISVKARSRGRARHTVWVARRRADSVLISHSRPAETSRVQRSMRPG